MPLAGVDFGGPVVVVGMNTAVQERLGRLKIAGIALDEGLDACRLRADGRAESPTGFISALQRDDQRILYLNTRVGWPRLRGGELHPGVVIIDRTSFASGHIFEAALAWAENHRAGTVLVISDIGDEQSLVTVRTQPREYGVWAWSRRLIDELVWELGAGPAHSALSTSSLLWQKVEGVRAILCQSDAADVKFRRGFYLLSEAARVGTPLPYAITAAKRLLSGLAQCLSTVEEYNLWAALDHRTTALSSLRSTVERTRPSDFAGPWRNYGETRWGELRREVLDLYALLLQENPKLFALCYTVERVRRERPEAKLVVRVASEAMGQALAADLTNLGEKAVEWMRISEKVPWTLTPVIELYPGALPPWWQPALWTGESTLRLHLTYPFESRYLEIVLRHGTAHQREASESAAKYYRLGTIPNGHPPPDLPIAYSFDVDARKVALQHPPDLTVDISLLLDDLELTDDSEEQPEHAEAADTAQARPVILEPDGQIWWVREGTAVEALVAGAHHYVPLHKLTSGETVIVPRGEGREALFTRLVKNIHGHGDLRAFEVFFARWRAACVKACEACGSSLAALEERMASHGSRIGSQALDNWATGATIGPADPRDIGRIGRIADDRFVVEQGARIGAMMTEVRGLHISLGHLLSAGLSEVADGAGESLSKLSVLLGMDASELLEEFEVRQVRSVGPVQEVGSSLVGRRVRP